MEPLTENLHRKKGTYGFTHMKPSDGNQHRKKKLPLLIAKAINSLPHKSFCFCSPMQNIWGQQLEPANETIK